MSNKWINQGGVYYPIGGNFKVYSTPGPGIFNIILDPNPMERRIGLQKIGNKFEFPFKIYDLGMDSFIDMIKKVWNSEYYESKNQNLGVIFNGLKGSG